MSYESKLVIVHKNNRLTDEINGKIYKLTDHIAEFDLSNAGPYVKERFDAANDADCFYYENKFPVIEDEYEKALKEVSISEAIDILENALAIDVKYGATPYRRFVACLGMLKGFKTCQDNKQWDDDLVVLCFGH